MNTLTITLFVVLAVALVFLLIRLRGGRVSPEAIQAARDRGARILDVRSPSEFSSGHVSGASNLPADRILNDPSVAGARDVPLMVYCQSGMRSSRAASTLRAAGYEVLDLGGIAQARSLLG
ncbi:MAG: rhodanese-like domain-containing protein [Deltaproteobacteria bacterium]|nr:MAG: rhodanese-like domain-containing protein [Deltaproteobacteria bacterium]